MLQKAVWLALVLAVILPQSGVQKVNQIPEHGILTAGLLVTPKPPINTKVGDKLQSHPVIFGLCTITSEPTQKPAGSLTWIPLPMCPSVVTLTKGDHARFNYRGGGKELSRAMLGGLRL